ncbi:MAG: c-type cytochrome biogenesis protein CcsB [Nocardioidaceae bacterium]
MSTAQFGSFSEHAIMFASIVYVLAFLAHLAEWAFARRLSVAVPISVPVAVPISERTSVPVSGRASVPVEARVGGGADGPPPPAAPAKDTGRALEIDRYGRIGVALTVLACALHLSGVVTRGLASDPIRVPWGNMYEFTLAATLGVSLMYLLLMHRYHLRWMGLIVTAFLVVVLMLDNLLLYEPAGPLVPALHSYWLAIHVTAAMVASGGFAIGAMTSALFLIKDRAVTKGTLRVGGYLDRLPELRVLDRVAYRVHAFSFPIWTFAALVAGPIWAEYAWGSYWNWDPKEIWAFITWVVYASYLHARATAGWRGRLAAVIALIGFATLLWNFVGINFFFGGGSMHSYAGK